MESGSNSCMGLSVSEVSVAMDVEGSNQNHLVKSPCHYGVQRDDIATRASVGFGLLWLSRLALPLEKAQKGKMRASANLMSFRRKALRHFGGICS